jgi:hypothetical protein
MSEVRSQQREFYQSALPGLFHATPGDFLYYLERDGNKFLHFYWEQVGKGFSVSDRVDANGLNYTMREPDKGVTIAMVLLPIPRLEGEAYFEAFIYRPHRVTPILRISDRTAVFALTLSHSEGVVPITNIVEFTRKAQTINHGIGPNPAIEDFYQAVIEIIRDSRGNL